MNPFLKRQEPHDIAQAGLQQAFMSPLMIALPASTTHTQDMFDQLRTAAELDLIQKPFFAILLEQRSIMGPKSLNFVVQRHIFESEKRVDDHSKACIDNAVIANHQNENLRKIWKRIKTIMHQETAH